MKAIPLTVLCKITTNPNPSKILILKPQHAGFLSEINNSEIQNLIIEVVAILVLVDIPFGGFKDIFLGFGRYVAILVLVDIPFGDMF